MYISVAMNMTWTVWLVACLALAQVSAELPDQDCPDDCDCHYWRINWVTDCSESNLTSVPTVEEGLSLGVYLLNMNANNLRELEPFPNDLKVWQLMSRELSIDPPSPVFKVQFI